MGTRIAGEFIQSIESLAENAEATAAHADAEARADDVHPNDAREAEIEADELGYIARELRTLAGMLYGRVMMKGAA